MKDQTRSVQVQEYIDWATTMYTSTISQRNDYQNNEIPENILQN